MREVANDNVPKGERLVRAVGWLGTATGVAGALLLAANVDGSGYGYVLFLVSSVSWALVASATNQRSLWVLQFVFTVVNLIGVYRWLL